MQGPPYFDPYFYTAHLQGSLPPSITLPQLLACAEEEDLDDDDDEEMSLEEELMLTFGSSLLLLFLLYVEGLNSSRTRVDLVCCEYVSGICVVDLFSSGY